MKLGPAKSLEERDEGHNPSGANCDAKHKRNWAGALVTEHNATLFNYYPSDIADLSVRYVLNLKLTRNFLLTIK